MNQVFRIAAGLFIQVGIYMAVMPEICNLTQGFGVILIGFGANLAISIPSKHE